MIFDCEDIHKVRLEMAEKYSKMTPEDAEKDFRASVESGLRAIEEIRRRNALKAG